MRHGLDVLVLLLSSTLVGPAGAAVFPVDSMLDAVDAAPGNGICATGSGDCTLRAAVQEANALAGADSVTLPAGTVLLALAGSGEDSAATGDLDVTETLTIEGQGAALTTIDGNDLDRVLHVVFSVSSPPDLTLRDLTVTGGQVSDDPGAGLYFESSGSVLIERTVFTDNHVVGSTSSAIGGAISSNAGGVLTVRSSRLVGNSAERGGALFNNSTLVVEDCAIVDNDARAGSALTDFGATILRRSLVSGNEATGNYTIVTESGSLEIEDTTISGNVDPFAVLDAVGVAVTLRNVTIAENDGSIAVRASTGTTVGIRNSIVYNPLATQECETNAGGVLASLGSTLDRDGTCATGAAGDQPSVDPLLGPLADNGGPTDTHRLLPASPAIDAGDDGSCTLQDQRGVARPRDGDGDGSARCDLGAVEVPEPGGAALGLAASGALAGCARRRRRIRRAA
jgi:CSLREA domain-containing protein